MSVRIKEEIQEVLHGENLMRKTQWTLKLRREHGWWCKRSVYAMFCDRVFRRYFDVPDDVKTIWLVMTSREPTKDLDKWIKVRGAGWEEYNSDFDYYTRNLHVKSFDGRTAPIVCRSFLNDIVNRFEIVDGDDVTLWVCVEYEQ